MLLEDDDIKEQMEEIEERWTKNLNIQRLKSGSLFQSGLGLKFQPNSSPFQKHDEDIFFGESIITF